MIREEFLEASLRTPLACSTEGSNQTLRANCLYQRVYKEFCCREEKLDQVAHSRQNLLGFNKEIKCVEHESKLSDCQDEGYKMSSEAHNISVMSLT